jgi:hypothetical protein
MTVYRMRPTEANLMVSAAAFWYLVICVKRTISRNRIHAGFGEFSYPNVKAMAPPLAGANVERGVEVVVTGKHGKQRG